MQKTKKDKQVAKKDLNKKVKTIIEDVPKKKKQQLDNIKKSVKKGIVEAPISKSTKKAKKQESEDEDEDEILEEMPSDQSESDQEHMEEDEAEEVSGEDSEIEEDAEEDDEEESEYDEDDVLDEQAEDDEEESDNEQETPKKIVSEKKSKKVEKDNVPLESPVLGSAVFVQECPPGTTRAELVKLFSSCGTVISVMFSYHHQLFFMPKIDKKFITVFVVFDNPEAADKALALEGTELNGNKLVVKKYDTSGKKPERKNTQYISKSTDGKNLAFVSNLHPKTTKRDLSTFFSSSCKTTRIVFAKNQPGKAFVSFEDPDAVKLALEFNGCELNGRKINVLKYKTKPTFNPKGKAPHPKSTLKNKA